MYDAGWLCQLRFLINKENSLINAGKVLPAFFYVPNDCLVLISIAVDCSSVKAFSFPILLN